MEEKFIVINRDKFVQILLSAGLTRGVASGIMNDCTCDLESLLTKAFKAGNKRGWSGYPDTDNWTQPDETEYLNNFTLPLAK